MRKTMIVLTAVGVIWALGAAARVPQASAAGGTIAGTVKFAGDPPPPQQISVTKDLQACGKEPIYDESLMVDQATRGIKWAVVKVEGAKGKWNGKQATIDQQVCKFRPHVLVTPPGKITVLNSDGVLHNFRTTSTKNPPLNRAQPGFRKQMEVELKQVENVKVTCDAHPWMAAWIVVSDHPYVAVTDEKGNFKIENVPPGSYTLEVWQETLGTTTQQVTVKAGETVSASFTLKQ
jgi:plastocyanin